MHGIQAAGAGIMGGDEPAELALVVYTLARGNSIVRRKTMAG